MNIEKEVLEDQTALLRVTVEETDYAETVDKTLRAYKRKANVPGFRPGMVPMNLVNKMYRKSVLAEESYKLASNGAFEYIKENQIGILGDLMPSDRQQEIDFDNDKSFEFAFQAGLAPEVKVSLSKKNVIEKYNVLVDDDMISDYRASFFRRHGNLAEVDEVGAEDAVTFNMSNEQKTIDDAYIGMGTAPEETRETLLGKKVGDKLEIDVKKLYPNPAQLAAMLMVQESEIGTVDPVFNMEITRIRRFVEPELTPEFFAEAFPQGDVKNAGDFEKKIADEVQAEITAQTAFKFTDQVRDYLLNKVELPLPEAFLRQWLFAANEGKFTMEQIDDEFPAFTKMMRWDLIKHDIAKENDIEITPDDLKEEARNLARQQFRMYGMSTVADDMLDHYVGEILKNQEEMRRLYDKAIEDRVVGKIAETVTIRTKDISVKEFSEMMNMGAPK